MKVLAIAVLILASLSTPVIAKTQASPSAKQLINSLKLIYKDSLKDPDSAKFKDVFLSLHETENAKALCGLANSKNSYGGYVGFQPFIVTMDGTVINNTEDVPTATLYLWPVWCSRPIK